MKKKILSITMAYLLAFGMAGCGTNQADSLKEQENITDSSNKDNAAHSETENHKETTSDSKSLVVYFSVPETDSAENMSSEEEFSTVVIDGEVLGNTQYVANVIAENTGAELFRIEPETAYPMDHAELEEVATKEKQNNAYPKISSKVENLEQYDTIFIGYPIWYADMPRIMYSFFEDNDLSGKTIIPFVTSGGSGFSGSIQTIAELEPHATVETDGLSISRNSVQNAEADIIDWVTNLGYVK